ncbi:hypothetical protein QCJ93_001071 [Enterobacter bugandensis]|nr:hypothetical protein [Enterobacter bugandensis]
MKYKLMLLMSMWTYDTKAIRWPSLSDPEITSCTIANNITCSHAVYYKHSGTVFLEQPELVKPPDVKSLTIRAYGIHCQRGSNLPGEVSPFTGCQWDTASKWHAPATYNCMRESLTSWDLNSSWPCTTDLSFGGHSGAGPGGECVLFGIMVGAILHTPMGAMDATSAANSGNRFCVKPLPPATKCDIQLHDTVLDHGVLTPNASSTASVSGVIECGQKPVVEFVGGADFMVAPGVNASLNANVETASNKIRVNSRLTTANASGGDYSASKVITVSPW